MARASIAGVIVNVGLNIALIPTLGIPAAAAATAASVIVQAVVVLRRTEVLLHQSMQITELLAAWGVGTLALVGISQLPTSGAGIALHLVVAAAICLFGSGAFLWLKRGFQAGHATSSAAQPA